MIPICNHDDYLRALERAEVLMHTPETEVPGTPEYIELDQLSEAIQTYEEEM